MRVHQAVIWTLLISPGLTHAACSVNSTSGAFGAYSLFNVAPADTAGTLRVSCNTTTLGYTLLLSPGGAGSYSPRKLAGGVYTLTYNLYVDALRSLVWGDGSGGTTTVSGAFALPGANDHTVCGRVPAQQNVGAGAYTDTITVTLNF